MGTSALPFASICLRTCFIFPCWFLSWNRFHNWINMFSFFPGGEKATGSHVSPPCHYMFSFFPGGGKPIGKPKTSGSSTPPLGVAPPGTSRRQSPAEARKLDLPQEELEAAQQVLNELIQASKRDLVPSAPGVEKIPGPLNSGLLTRYM